MIQGTTPTISLRIPLDVKNVKDAEFTLSHNGELIRTWKLAEMEGEPDQRVLRIHLTEQDTLGMMPGLHIGQLRVRMSNDEIVATGEIPIYVKDLVSEVTI